MGFKIAMRFLTRLWYPKTADIVGRLMKIGEELAVAQKSINKLAQTQDAYIRDDENDHRARCLEAAIEDYGIAMWAKDLEGKFIYANKVCCEMILRCTLEEAIGAKDDDLPDNALAKACAQSDQKVISQETTLRHIEHGFYQDKHVFLDTVKSPFYGKHGLVGTLGSGHDITSDIPEDLVSACSYAYTIEVPIKAVLSADNIRQFIELNECKEIVENGANDDAG